MLNAFCVGVGIFIMKTLLSEAYLAFYDYNTRRCRDIMAIYSDDLTY